MPELINRVLVLQTGAPCFSIHMCNCRRRDNDFLSWYYTPSNVHVGLVWHSDDIKMHPEAQSLGVDGLEDWQAKQLVDVKLNATVSAFARTRINLVPHAREQLGVAIYFKDGPRRGRNGVSYPVINEPEAPTRVMFCRN